MIDMTWEAAGVIAEIVGAIAVVVSLWYLAIQMKQNTELERAELEVQLGVTWAELHDNMIQYPKLAKAYDLAANDWDEMTDEDVRAYLWFMAKSFHILEGMFRQYRRGLLAEDVWNPYDRFIIGALKIEAVMGWWQSDAALVSTEFKDHVEILLQLPNDTSWRQLSTTDIVASITETK